MLRSAPLNVQVHYTLAGVPRAHDLSLSVAVENTGVAMTIDTFVTGQADLIIPNSPPTIESVVATRNGQPVYRVSPGTTVQVTASASDPDGDPLTYQ